MDGKGMQLALREMRQHFSDPRVLAGMAVIAAILGFAGPFGTFGRLETLPRIAYWTAIVFLTYAAGYGVGVLLGAPVRRHTDNPAVRVVLLGLAAGLPVTAAVVLVNLIAFGADASTGLELGVLWIYCTLIATGINTLSELLAPGPDSRAGPDARPSAAAASILERVPLPQRGRLLSLSVADHYVEVVTDKGEALLLMRLSDAIREADPEPGLQIHRSHWVAHAAVSRVVRASGRPSVELIDGRRLPISRSFIADAKAAGLLV